MKLRSLALVTATVAVCALSVLAGEVKLDGIKCVMNPKAAAKAEKMVKYKGGQVFFCCDNCPKAFQAKIKEGDKLVAAKGNHQLVATKQVKQSKCPFSGGPAKDATAIKVAGASIAFCCENCQAKAKAMEGNDQIESLFGDAAYKKAGFKLVKAEFTSEGAPDPAKSGESNDGFTSEGAEDPEKKPAESKDDVTSEGAEDPN